jgi:L,D-transpeptidase catalytic domain/Putative peptidoglycan binding domain
MLRRVRRGIALAIALLSVVPPAAAARRDVTVQASPAVGPAPLAVTFTATGDATSVHWIFGDNTAGEGLVAEHTYSAGTWTAFWDAQTPSGPRSGSVQITASGLAFAAPADARYARRSPFTGSVIPAEKGVRVTLVGPHGNLGATATRANGSYGFKARIRLPGTYFATSDHGTSAKRTVRVVPRLLTRLVGSGARESRYEVAARVLPAAAGTLAVRITRGGVAVLDRSFGPHVRIKLDTRRIATYRIRVAVTANAGYDAVAHLLTGRVVLPRLASGARGAAVTQLGGRLRQFHYAVPFTATFDSRMLDSVYAFQKVQGLPRTGVVDARFWRRLADPYIPKPRSAVPADHLEVNKPTQVLYVVRGSRIAQIIPVSTAGLPGKFTPVGRFSIIRKVTGFDPSPLGTLYDPMYFTGGYAIHGNPSVPPYPASHGCVRVPMWIAANLYATNPYGETVYVY